MTHHIILLLLVLTVRTSADLVLLYRFDEAGQTDWAQDQVGDNHAQWISAANPAPNWQPAQGVVGGAIRLPGIGNHQNFFQIASIPELNNNEAGMSVTCWFRARTGISGYRGLFMTREANGGNFGLGHENHNIDCRVDGSAIDSPVGSVSPGSDWVHLAWVWDAMEKTQRLYLDGELIVGPSSVPSPPITTNFDWRIGDDACCNNRNLGGDLDELAVWDHPLSQLEISEIYEKNLQGISSDETPPPPVTEPLNVGLVINEIHYDADPKTEFVEFLEILNTGPDPLDLSGYQVRGGVEFSFPPGTQLGVAQYLILAEDPTALQEAYDNLPVVMEYDGSLSNDGEMVSLVSNAGVILDEVNYGVEFPWPIVDEGTSMQLINATLDNDLGGSWRPAIPSPGIQNGTFLENAAPQMRQVDHFPKQPTSSESTEISVKVTDLDGVESVTLYYQIVPPGDFIPAFLPLSTSVLKNAPETQALINPSFEDPENWQSLPMSLSLEKYRATIPSQDHRTLLRYRIEAKDILGNTIRAPFPEDPSLNFAYFVYDGVPDYTADFESVHPNGPGHTYSAESLTAIPVYHLITRSEDLAQCWAYSASDQLGSVASRKVFNWEGAMVYDGVVYDHIGYRLRQRNDRYIGEGRRSMRFRFRRGHYFQARDLEGKNFPVKWRSMNTSKRSRFREGSNHGMRELVSARLWNLAGVVAPKFQHVHFRVIDQAEEAPDQYEGDFYGLSLVFEDVDAQFLQGRDLPRGNVYKLKDKELNPFELQKYQARSAVDDASDFINIRDNLGPPSQSDQWLRDHVDWDSWYLYAALGEGFRHYDFSPGFQKNRIWYFKPAADKPLGLMSVIPHDTDGTWKYGTNDQEWDDPRYVGGTLPNGTSYRGRVVGIDLPKEAIQEITGLDGTDGENHPEREAFMLEYRNTIREVNDLLWHPETVNHVIDEEAERIATLSLADRDRWTYGPTTAGRETIRPLEETVNLMKSLAFEEDRYLGERVTGGRSEWLRRLAIDSKIPNTPTISYTGSAGFPVDQLAFQSSAFADPDGGSGSFAMTEWRLAEITSDPQEPRFEWHASWEEMGLTNAITPPAIATRAGRTYRARVRHQDDSGRWSHWSSPLEFTASAPDLSGLRSHLVISEVMYHPSSPTAAEVSAGFLDADEFEYLEIRNVGTQTISLQDIRLTKGVDFDFSEGAISTLPPGGYMLVVENIDAFLFRYGDGHPIAGQWSGGLSNAGERVKLSFGAGLSLIEFTYDDLGPWPVEADGDGNSLALVHPRALSDPTQPLFWRSSPATPGTTDTTTFTGGSLLSYATNNTPLQMSRGPDGVLLFSTVVNQKADDLIALPQYSVTLTDWSEDMGNFALDSVEPLGNDFARVTWRYSGASPVERGFVRYFFQLQ